MIESALVAGLTSMGVDSLLLGPFSTPGVAFITRAYRADAGVVISASHNPYEDNGIKIFDRDGYKLSDEKEFILEDLILNGTSGDIAPSPNNIGKVFRIADAPGRYVVFAKNSFPSGMTLDGIKIVLDCANGAAYKVAPTILKELGAELITIGVTPDGKNINTDCGSLNLDILKNNVLQTGADLGIALDGDADRVIFCDEKGKNVDGDKIIAMCAREMVNKGTLKGNTVVTTVMSNMALERFIKDMGVDFVRTQVGDRYVVEEMRKRGCNLGGEQSGHIIFTDLTTTGDGTIAALQVLAIMRGMEKSLSELSNIIDPYPQLLLNVRVEEKKEITQIKGLAELVDKNEQRLNGKGRINVRYSGTEPILRVMVEGENSTLIEEIAAEIANKVEKEIGAKK